MSSESDDRASAARIARSLLFYACFYSGTVFFVLAAMAALPFSLRAFRAAVHGWSSYHRLCARALVGIKVRLEGEALPGPVLYAGRHESFFEAIDLPQILPVPVIFAKAELMRLPGWGVAARSYGVVPVERDQGAKALRAMVNTAKAFAHSGRPVAIFPEGTRVPHLSSPPLQSGFAGLYKLLGLPVVPIAVDSGRLYHRWWKRPGTITYRFAPPIPPGLPRGEVEEQVRRAINDLNPGWSEPTQPE
jgi:1-acyl-sn-glycerol-3-phosphate acyltransferase